MPETELELLSEVYGRPLPEFVRARNELASQLDEQGRSQEAGSIRRARKPTVTAWAVDRLTHERHDELRELVETTDVIAAADDASELRAARDRRMALISELTDAAVDILHRSGSAAGGAQRARITSTLIAASVGEERDRLLSGTLERDVEAAGFEGASLSVPAPEPSPTRDRARERADELVRRAEAAEKEAERLERESRRLHDEAARARQRAKRERERADAAAASRKRS